MKEIDDVLKIKLKLISVPVWYACLSEIKTSVSARQAATLQKLVKSELRNTTEFKVFPCPTNSPDLNPMMYLWDVLDKQV